MPKISIIIPVYNTEKYLAKAIDSILESSIIKDIEIIVVDDNSPGNCKEIVDKYKENIIYLKHDINKGVFKARFTGYEYATGEFLIHLDPDDFVFNDIYTKSYIFAKENNSDIVMFNTQNINSENQIWINKDDKIPSFINKRGLDIIDFILFSHTNKWPLHSCCNKLIKKDIVKNVLKNLKNVENVNLADDLLWSICFFLELKDKNSISSISLIGLNYFKHKQSMTKIISKESFIKNICSINKVFTKLADLFDQFKLNEKYIKLLIKNKFYSLNHQYQKAPKEFSFYLPLDYFKLLFYKAFFSKFYENFYITLCIKNILNKVIQKNITEISIYGTGKLAIHLKEQLEKNNIKVRYFLSTENYDSLHEIDKIPLFSINELVNIQIDYMIIASINSVEEICDTLIKKNIFPKDIISIYS